MSADFAHSDERTREVIVAISWILELPHDLGLPDDSRVDIARAGGMHGWAEDELAEIPRWDDPQPGCHPVLSLRFRRARVGIGMPTEATDRCFSDMQTAAMSYRDQRRFIRQLDRLTAQGAWEWKTVVRLTRWYSDQALPQVDRAEDWLRSELRSGLSVLNRWLSVYALVSMSHVYGPLALGDLPAQVPTVFEHKDAPDSAVELGHMLLPIHNRLPSLRPGQPHMDAAEQASQALLLGDDDNPFLDGLLLLFGAQGHLATGRERQAVLDAGTAIEMLISAVLRAVGELRDSFDAGLALRAGFARRLKHHLPLALRSESVTEITAWNENGYQLRNAVVHEGRQANMEQATAAVDSAWDLVDAVGKRLRDCADTARLGRLMIVRRTPPDGG